MDKEREDKQRLLHGSTKSGALRCSIYMKDNQGMLWFILGFYVQMNL